MIDSKNGEDTRTQLPSPSALSIGVDIWYADLLDALTSFDTLGDHMRYRLSKLFALITISCAIVIVPILGAYLWSLRSVTTVVFEDKYQVSALLPEVQVFASKLTGLRGLTVDARFNAFVVTSRAGNIDENCAAISRHIRDIKLMHAKRVAQSEQATDMDRPWWIQYAYLPVSNEANNVIDQNP